MECELFLSSKLSHKALGEVLESIVKSMLNEEIFVTDNVDEIHIACKYFSMDIEIEDISDLSFVGSHYELYVNKTIRILVFGNSFKLGLNYLFEVIGKLIKVVKGNLLLLENGSDQLIRKEKDILVINSELNEYQSKYLSKNLIKLLDYPYIEKKLSIK
ncbi:hypothetical protein [Gottfriedia solisilvae]|uniref:Uncharacterized protein n=1 Tax=Gottfriedia solisilvae TaxID=1516104 RepID=A0A8J3F2U1_9BACI|nr:hypothetical protein [Gottfriedia solisilvae]GGI18061.1 hypothetical protein GCM10007380_41050 [Gottfriedia solisilvae]